MFSHIFIARSLADGKAHKAKVLGAVAGSVSGVALVAVVVVAVFAFVRRRRKELGFRRPAGRSNGVVPANSSPPPRLFTSITRFHANGTIKATVPESALRAAAGKRQRGEWAAMYSQNPLFRMTSSTGGGKVVVTV